MLAVLWLLSECLARPNMVGAYIAPKRDQAKRIAFEMFKAYAPPGTDFNASELKITLPNGTVIDEFDSAAARSLLDFLLGPAGRSAFDRHSFLPPEAAR